MLAEVQSFSRNARLFLLSNSIFSVSAGIFYLVFNIYVVEGLSYSEYFLGVLLSATSFTAALFSLPAGIIGDRIRRKRCLILGAVGTTIFMGGLTLVTLQPVLVAINALLGFCTTLTYVSVAPFMAENTSEKERVHLFSVQGALSTLCYTAGAYLGGYLPSLLDMPPSASLRTVLQVAVVLSVVAVVPLFSLTEEKREEVFSRTVVESVGLTKKFFVTQSLMGFGAGLVVPFFNVFFRQKLSVDLETIGLIFSVGNIAMGIAIFLSAPVVMRWGKVRSIVATELASLPFLLMIAYSPHVGVAAFGFIMRGALMNMGSPIVYAFMMEHLEEKERATVNGIVQGGWNGFWAISNIVAGVLMSRNMYEMPFLLTCVMYGFSSLLFYRFFALLDVKKEKNQAIHH